MVSIEEHIRSGLRESEEQRRTAGDAHNQESVEQAVDRLMAVIAAAGGIPAQERWGLRLDDAGSVEYYEDQAAARRAQHQFGGTLMCTVDWEPR